MYLVYTIKNSGVMLPKIVLVSRYWFYDIGRLLIMYFEFEKVLLFCIRRYINYKMV